MTLTLRDGMVDSPLNLYTAEPIEPVYDSDNNLVPFTWDTDFSEIDTEELIPDEELTATTYGNRTYYLTKTPNCMNCLTVHVATDSGAQIEEASEAIAEPDDQGDSG